MSIIAAFCAGGSQGGRYFKGESSFEFPITKTAPQNVFLLEKQMAPALILFSSLKNVASLVKQN